MAKSWNRLETWFAVFAVGVGVLIVGILGLYAYMTATATTLHPDPERVHSVPHSATPARWADAVEQARQAVRAGLAQQNVPGISVAVGMDDDLVWAEGFGWADLENSVPVGPETRFRIGTASMVLTSAAVGLLLEEGRLKLDDEIQKYVPEYPRKEWPITLRQVMGHVAGIRNDSGDESPMYSRHCERPVEAIPVFGDRGLRFEPGTRFSGSNYGWILVSAAVETAAGQPFLRFMRDRVFEPLGMEDTRAESTTEPIPNRAAFYFPRFAAEPRYGLHPMREIDLSCYAGASVFLSTASDMVRFGLGITNGKLLQPATVQLLQTAQRLRTGEETGYGLGWELETVTLGDAQVRAAGHDGATLGGPVATLLTFPERRLVVAVLSNISYTDTASLAVKVAEAFAAVAAPGA